MPEIYFTSDTHFNHKNILKYNPNRLEHSYDDSVEGMNQAIVDRWNAVVKPNDTVYHLGDVAFGRPEDSVKWILQLNGNITLIRGNHDYSTYLEAFGHLLYDVRDYLFLRNFKNEKVAMFHYPIVNWDGKHHGSYHLYGHVHGTPVHQLKGTRSADIGIDTHPEMRPYEWYEIHNWMKKIPPPKLNHHEDTRKV